MRMVVEKKEKKIREKKNNKRGSSRLADQFKYT